MTDLKAAVGYIHPCKRVTALCSMRRSASQPISEEERMINDNNQVVDKITSSA